MKKYNQKIVDNKIGDCFRACMATVLQVSPDVLPNDHSASWHSTWAVFLRQFGLDLIFGGREGAIWMGGYWIASVKSINYEDGNHAIVMQGSQVYHDPSTKKRYKTGKSMLGNKAVNGGYHLVIDDATLLHRLEEYRQKIAS